MDIKRLRAHLKVAESTIEAAKGEVKLGEHINTERLRCMLKHLGQTSVEIIDLLDDADQRQIVLDLDPQPVQE